MRGVGLLVVLGAFNCTQSNPAATCKEGTCLDPAYPYCDQEGAISGEPGSCIAVNCTPGSVAVCLGGEAITCAGDGTAYERVACDLGCRSSPTPHCAYIEPRYTPDACDVLAEDEALEITVSGTLDANLDSNCNGGVIPQTGAPGICVLRYRRIHIAANATLRLEDTPSVSPGRVVAFVADELVSIEGTLDISANGSLSGPGGGAIQSGGPTRVNGVEDGPGGGGAGGKTAGAPGGNQIQDGGAMNGGAAAADPAFLAALIGGAATYQFDDENMRAIGGGGGGGAATLIACQGAVRVTGMINAGGGGGMGGILWLFGSQLPGFGGGAGGYVVLQAKTIEVTGMMFANGGGGGGGMQSNNVSGVAGEDGSLSATTPAKGGFPQNGEGRGGNGGILGTLPTQGGKPTIAPASAGGGGGSIGFFQTYTPEGWPPMLAPVVASPDFQTNGVSRTR